VVAKTLHLVVTGSHNLPKPLPDSAQTICRGNAKTAGYGACNKQGSAKKSPGQDDEQRTAPELEPRAEQARDQEPDNNCHIGSCNTERGNAALSWGGVFNRPRLPWRVLRRFGDECR